MPVGVLSGGSDAAWRKAKAQWRSDLDDVEELLTDFTETLKVGVAGSWTLAANVESLRGRKIISDQGAVRELGEALREGIATLFTDLDRRLSSAHLSLQLDEPSLLAVADGRIPTASGWDHYAAVPSAIVCQELQSFSQRFDGAWLHCCAHGDWLTLAERSGFRRVSVDSRLFVTAAEIDALANWVGAERELILGVVNAASPGEVDSDTLVSEALRALAPIEVPGLEAWISLGTGCGLSGWSVQQATVTLRQLRAAARLVVERLH